MAALTLSHNNVRLGTKSFCLLAGAYVCMAGTWYVRLFMAGMYVRVCRSCQHNQFYYNDGSGGGVEERQPYCIDSCSAQTMCGDTVVPDSHLQVPLVIS